MAMSQVLLTGFEPFNSADTNPSWEAVQLARGQLAMPTTAVELSVEFAASATELRKAIEQSTPEVVICVGQAARRHALTVERVAVNLIDAPIPDNAESQPVDQPVIADAPDAYFASLPVKACVEAARAAGVPAAASMTAGTYVCNSIFFHLQHLIATEYPHLKGGFVHVPLSSQQGIDGSVPTLPPHMVAAGLTAIVHTALMVDSDIEVVGGQTH